MNILNITSYGFYPIHHYYLLEVFYLWNPFLWLPCWWYHWNYVCHQMHQRYRSISYWSLSLHIHCQTSLALTPFLKYPLLHHASFMLFVFSMYHCIFTSLNGSLLFLSSLIFRSQEYAQVLGLPIPKVCLWSNSYSVEIFSSFQWGCWDRASLHSFDINEAFMMLHVSNILL